VFWNTTLQLSMQNLEGPIIQNDNKAIKFKCDENYFYIN